MLEVTKVARPGEVMSSNQRNAETIFTKILFFNSRSNNADRKGIRPAPEAPP